MTKWLFTFDLDNSWDLDSTQSDKIVTLLGLSSKDELLGLDPGGSREFSPDEVAAKYVDLDSLFLDKFWVEVFYENFSSPELLFSKPENLFVEGLTNSSTQELKSARLTQVKISDGESGLSIKFYLEVKFELDVLDGVNVDAYDQANEESGLSEQIFECNNMCNFGFNDLELENDDALSHNWVAEQV